MSKESSLSAREILDHFQGEYEEKAVKYALRRLLENKLIFRVPNLLDMRSVYYRLANMDELSSIRDRMSQDISEEIMKVLA